MQEHIHVVRYHEVDPQSHVYHSRYLEIADAGFSDYLADLFGLPYSQFVGHSFDPSLVVTKVEFLAPARYEDRLRVQVEPTRVGNSSFEVFVRIDRESDDRPIATLTTTYVNYDVQSGRSREIPARFAELLREEIPDPAPTA